MESFPADGKVYKQCVVCLLFAGSVRFVFHGLYRYRMDKEMLREEPAGTKNDYKVFIISGTVV